MRLPKSGRGIATGVALAFFAVLLAACAGEYPQSSIDPKTDFARTIHDLYGMVTWISLGILVVVWGALGWVLLRYRERPDTPHPKQVHGHLGLEVAWTAVPALLVVLIAIPTIRAVFATQRGHEGDALVVEVQGNRFWWRFTYPESGVVTANELHLPVGEPVSLRLESADVIHSFWVPKLGGKRDVNPLRNRPDGDPEGRTWLHFTVEEPGVYMGQCAEFCGESHSLMGLRVIVEPPAEFRAWLDRWSAGVGETADSVAEGRRLFENSSCIACHAVEGTSARGRVGPDLTLLGTRTTIASGWLDNSVDNLVRWITAPRSIKPAAAMPGTAEGGGSFPPTNLTEDQVREIARYLHSLR